MNASETESSCGGSPAGSPSVSAASGAQPGDRAWQELRAWLEGLSVADRRMVLLHYADGLSVFEISSVLNLTPSAVAEQLGALRRAAVANLTRSGDAISWRIEIPDDFPVNVTLGPATVQAMRSGVIDAGFATGDVARICGVSARTVCKWCDTGLLKCHRMPRGPFQAGHRRILRADLEAFMRQHDIPSRRGDLL